MLLNINGNIENVLLENDGQIDLLDFEYLVSKYIGNEASIYYRNAVESLNNQCDNFREKANQLEDELTTLTEKIYKLKEKYLS